MHLHDRQNVNNTEESMSNGLLLVKCDKPLRVLGIDLGTTNSVMTEIKWQHGSTPETKVIQIERDTPLGCFTDILFPSVVAIQAGKVWVGEDANRMKKNPQEFKLIQVLTEFYYIPLLAL